MFRGSFIELNWSAKALTDLRELRSSFRTSIRAVGFFSKMVFLASDAASVFLAAMMTWAPLRAKTLDVSRPMPLAPPVMMTVRRLASTPSVTCSAVDADPNPLAPALPVMSEKIPLADSTPQLSNKRTETEPNCNPRTE